MRFALGVLILLVSSAWAQDSFNQRFVGKWQVTDPNTGSVVRIIEVDSSGNMDTLYPKIPAQADINFGRVVTRNGGTVFLSGQRTDGTGISNVYAAAAVSYDSRAKSSQDPIQAKKFQQTADGFRKLQGSLGFHYDETKKAWLNAAPAELNDIFNSSLIRASDTELTTIAKNELEQKNGLGVRSVSSTIISAGSTLSGGQKAVFDLFSGKAQADFTAPPQIKIDGATQGSFVMNPVDRSMLLQTNAGLSTRCIYGDLPLSNATVTLKCGAALDQFTVTLYSAAPAGDSGSLGSH